MKINQGITLIALVITIILLLILAGVGIATLTGEGGILNKASTAKVENSKSSVEEELKIAMMAIKTEAIERGEKPTLQDLIEEKSNYSLEKQFDFKWIDKNSNPLLIQKDGIFCYIYDDLTIEVSITNETFGITTNLQNCKLSNTKTRLVKDTSYTTEVLLDKFYVIESVNILMGEQDITEQAYNRENGTISIERLKDNITITIVSKIEFDQIATLVQMLDENCNYTTMAEVISDTNLFNRLLSNEKTLDYIFNSKDVILPGITSNAQAFTAVIDHETAFQAMCENANARLAMYNSYTVTESILGNSSKALEGMKNSSRYEVINGVVDARNGGTLYGGKAFVFSVSQNCSNDNSKAGDIYTYNCYHHGTYVNGGNIENKSAYKWYGTTGLIGNIKKFASSVKAWHYNHYHGGGDKGTGYAAIFKI